MGIATRSAFAFREVAKRYRKDLADQLGNLVMRCASKKVNPAMEAPRQPDAISEVETELIEKLKSLRGTSMLGCAHSRTLLKRFATSTRLIYREYRKGGFFVGNRSGV